MQPLLVCGNINVETVFESPEPQLPAGGGFFPDRLSLNVSGVGANLTHALSRLGSPVRFLSFAGADAAGQLVRGAFPAAETHFAATDATPQSLSIVRPDGSHTFYRDLKDTPHLAEPLEACRSLLPGCKAALMTNVGWTQELLPVVQAADVPILTDVQDIRTLDNPYDAPYFAAADVLLLSAEHLPDPAATLEALRQRTPARLIIAGCGEGGALLAERGQPLHHQPAFSVPVRQKGGAGDALAAAFAHFYFTRERLGQEALRLACAAAALKLRGAGSGLGHPDEAEVRALAGVREK